MGGLLTFVYARTLARIGPPAIGVAVGLGLAADSPVLSLSILVATPAMVALAVAVGAASGIAGRHAVTHVVGGRGIRGSVRLVAGVVVFAATFAIASLVGAPFSDSTRFGPESGLDSLSPVIEFFRPSGDATGILALRWLAAFSTLSLIVLALVSVSVASAQRHWLADPVGTSRAVDSRSLLARGRLDRLLGGRVSRSTRTVIRGTWRVERRNPRGLLYPTFVLVFVGVLGFPVFALAGIPFALLLVLALGLAAGVVFGTDPVGRAYRPLPLLLTTADARTFVVGPLVATVLTAVVLVAVGFVPLGLLSAASVPETLLLAVVGVGFAATTTAVALAMGLDVSTDAVGRVPTYFSDVRTYGETGWGQFRRVGTGFLLTSAVGLPAFLGNAAWVYDPLAAVGVPIVAVRLGSLALTICVAAGVSWWSSRVAIERYRGYELV
ncbi:hypothetical protein ACFOUR_11675 [Halovivax cerinus]|uniref:Uncharacterized protein n=1 Tax=Halovivax cerinus TaxID=1487865 RepID=A0ABD5NPS1_9EURY